MSDGMFDERAFQSWFNGLPWHADFIKKYDEQPNPDDPDYDYRAAYQAGQGPNAATNHWPSQFKGVLHPRRFLELNPMSQEDLNGQLMDTATMQPTTDANVILSRMLGQAKLY